MASSRRVHQVLSNGLPSVESALPPIHINQQVSNKVKHKGEGATSLNHRLPPQKGATSPRGAHLFSHMCSNQIIYAINHVPNGVILSPLTAF
jgi:hypothetical protein